MRETIVKLGSTPFNQSLLDGLSSDQLEAAEVLCAAYGKWRTTLADVNEENALLLIDAYAHILELNAFYKWPMLSAHDLVGVPKRDIQAIDDQFNNLRNWSTENLRKRRAQSRFAEAKQRFAENARAPFAYTFDTDELATLQRLVNEVRDNLVGLETVPENWRTRMLRKLEALQGELHERMSTMDRFWGVVGEAIPVLYRAGVAAKPIVNRLREMAEIGLRVHAVFYGLPAPPGVAFLPPAEDDPPLLP